MQTVADIERPLKERIAALTAANEALQARLREVPSETILRHYKQAAHDIGDLFCWCVENLYMFPPAPGEKPWLEGIKDRLKAGHAADTRIVDELKAMKQRADAAEAKLAAVREAMEKQIKHPSLSGFQDIYELVKDTK